LRAGTGNSERGQNYGVWKQTKKQTKTQNYCQNYSCQDSKKNKKLFPTFVASRAPRRIVAVGSAGKKQIAESFSELKTKKTNRIGC
jgi:hypothetical protein